MFICKFFPATLLLYLTSMNYFRMRLTNFPFCPKKLMNKKEKQICKYKMASMQSFKIYSKY